MISGLEACAIKLGAVVVKGACRAWLGDTAAKDMSGELTDMLANQVTSLLDRRRAVAAFTEIGDRVAERILSSYGTEFRNLEDNERSAAINAVSTTLLKVPFNSAFVVKKDVDANAIEAYLRSHDPARAMKDGLSEDARDLYDILLRQCTQDLIGIIRTLPPFSADAFTEGLRRLTELAEQVRTSSEKLLARVAPFNHSEFEELYRSHAIEEMRTFDLEAPDLYSHTRCYDLRRAYIDMTACTIDSSADRFSLSDFAAQTHRLVIVGEGRSGTTGVLRRLFINSISRSFTGALAKWNSTIPIFLQLRSFDSEPPTPELFLARIANDITAEMPQGWVQYNLRQGKVLLLINGLAEVSPARRETLIEWIRRLIVRFPNIRYVIESSIIVPELPQLQQLGFSIAKLTNIPASEVAAFVARWHNAVALGIPDSDAKAKTFERSRQLIDGLKTCPQLDELARRPLLCALICAFHLDYGIDIPSNWVEILPQILSVMLDHRDRRRGIDSIGFSYRQYVSLVSDLAYWLVRNRWPQVDSARLRAWLARRLPLIPGEATRDAEAVKYDLIRRGILLCDTDNTVAFAADVMRNYLAAIRIVAADDIGYVIAEAHQADMRDIVIMVALYAHPMQLGELLAGIRTRRYHEPAYSFQFLQLEVACRRARDAALPVLRPGLSVITPMAEEWVP